MDDEVVDYWCNERTKGSLKNRHSQKLQERTATKGTTDTFAMKLLPQKLDLAAHGHEGPGVETKKPNKAMISHIFFYVAILHTWPCKLFQAYGIRSIIYVFENNL